MARELRRKSAFDAEKFDMGTISKALNLLNYFSESTPELGLMDFTKLSGQDKATVHRHLSEMARNGFLEQNPGNRKYRLGGAILRLSAVREKSFPTRRIVSQCVDQLARQVGELVHCSIIQNTEMSPVYYFDASNAATRVNFSEAEMLPLHATSSGLTALAFGPPKLLESLTSKDLARYTSNTITDLQTLRDAVEHIRAKGFAFSDQSYEEDVCSVAVPFFEVGPHAYGTVAIAIPASRFDPGKKPELVDGLRRASHAISQQLGGSIPLQLKSLWRQAA
jgi:DNA-binding IclR family transcriptional regulator